jgi:hypothetical protein
MRRARLAVLFVVGLGMLGWSTREANAAIAASGNLSFGSVHRGTAAATQTVDITSDVGGSPGDVMVTIVETCPDVSVSPASGTVPRMGTGVLTLTVTYTASASTRGVMPTCTIDVNGSSSTSFTVDGTSIAPARITGTHAADFSFRDHGCVQACRRARRRARRRSRSTRRTRTGSGARRRGRGCGPRR